ncbi:MAG: TIM-barrel domain-containing protein [Terracidiphilus sp.]
MGWSSWSSLRGQPTEEKIKAQVDALFAAHLPELGYRYINIDSGWSDGYDERGIPKPNLSRFPDGMAGMAAYLHSRGLRFGLYLGPGIRPSLYDANPVIAGTTAHIQDITDKTLPGSTLRNTYKIDFTKPAARAYINSIVQQFARWKVDFVKLDFVGPGGGNLPADNREEIRQWHAAILRSGRPIWLELSNWLSIDQAKLWRANANGWRIENDIECYACGRSTDPAIKGNLTDWSTRVVDRFTDVRDWIPYARPGGWNDFDSLELGNGDKDGITPPERQSMFILWAISCAPLYLGTDLTHMDPGDLKLISNRDIIAIDQRGIPASPLDIQSLRKKPGQAWMNLYRDGSAVLSLFNLGPDPALIKFDWREVDALRDTHFALHPPKLTDLITGEEIAPSEEGINLTLASHASRIFRITPAK